MDSLKIYRFWLENEYFDKDTRNELEKIKSMLM